MAEFNWWLLIVGLVIGAALVWLVLSDSRRRESEISEDELPKEATWIAETLRQSGRRIDPETAEGVLRLHRTYLASLPPDDLDEDESDEWDEPAPAPDRRDVVTRSAESPEPTSRLEVPGHQAHQAPGHQAPGH
jgi:hypothetical protein